MPDETRCISSPLPILVIAEDDQDLREALIELVQDHFPGRLTVLGAPDGLTARALCDSHAVAVVVADYLMPRMSGLSLYLDLRASVRTCKIPIALITGRTRDATLQEAQRSHGFPVFLKPEGVYGILPWLQTHVTLDS